MSLRARFAEEVERFVRVCRALYEKGFVASHGGNCAWRLDDDVILITATRLNKGEHTPEDVVFVDSRGGKLEGTREPTGEVPMYVNFFKRRGDVQSVIHCHPPVTCAFAACRGENLLERPVFPEVVLEVGPVPLVPYATPLTERLAERFDPFLERYNAFLMENHGLVLLSPRGIEWAWYLVEEVEAAAESLWRASLMGGVKELSREDLAEMDAVVERRGLPRCGAPGVNGSLVDLYFPGE